MTSSAALGSAIDDDPHVRALLRDRQRLLDQLTMLDADGSARLVDATAEWRAMLEKQLAQIEDVLRELFLERAAHRSRAARPARVRLYHWRWTHRNLAPLAIFLCIPQL